MQIDIGLKNILINAQSHDRLRICRACTEKGYSPMDVLPYECQSSRKHYAGHLKFPKVSLKHFKPGLNKKLICLDCANEERSQEKSGKRKRGNEESKYLIFSSTRIFV